MECNQFYILFSFFIQPFNSGDRTNHSVQIEVFKKRACFRENVQRTSICYVAVGTSGEIPLLKEGNYWALCS
jgi:hypothetical protein